MAKGSSRERASSPHAPPRVGAPLGPRRLLAVPANDNRVPAHVRGVRAALLATCLAVLLWSLWRLIAA